MNYLAILAVIAAAFAIWAMVSVSKIVDLTPGQRVMWFFIAILIPILGPLIYYFIIVKKSSA